MSYLVPMGKILSPPLGAEGPVAPVGETAGVVAAGVVASL